MSSKYTTTLILTLGENSNDVVYHDVNGKEHVLKGISYWSDDQNSFRRCLGFLYDATPVTLEAEYSFEYSIERVFIGKPGNQIVDLFRLSEFVYETRNFHWNKDIKKIWHEKIIEGAYERYYSASDKTPDDKADCDEYCDEPCLERYHVTN